MRCACDDSRIVVILLCTRFHASLSVASSSSRISSQSNANYIEAALQRATSRRHTVAPSAERKQRIEELGSSVVTSLTVALAYDKLFQLTVDYSNEDSVHRSPLKVDEPPLQTACHLWPATAAVSIWISRVMRILAVVRCLLAMHSQDFRGHLT